jgi:hypothetical protein
MNGRTDGYDAATRNSSVLRAYLKTMQLMLYSEIITVCSQIHTKHINTLCEQNVELLKVKLGVHVVVNGIRKTGKG